MFKRWIFVLLVGILVLGAFQVASAYSSGSGGFKGGFHFERGPCAAPWVNEISEETREQIQSIRDNFWEQMKELREIIWGYRNAGDLENLREAQEERQQLREEMHEEISEHLPEEYRERIEDMGPGKRNSGFRGGRVNSFDWRHSR